jgi:hypothetical protein
MVVNVRLELRHWGALLSAKTDPLGSHANGRMTGLGSYPAWLNCA